MLVLRTHSHKANDTGKKKKGLKKTIVCVVDQVGGYFKRFIGIGIERVHC